MREALEKIAAPTYGLQSIQEDYSDPNAFNYHAMQYWMKLTFRYQAIARAALAGGPAPDVYNSQKVWRSAQWAAYNEVLSWINAQDQKLIAKGDLYDAVMELRPSDPNKGEMK